MICFIIIFYFFFFFQAEDGIRDRNVTGVQTCALPILMPAMARDGWWGVISQAGVALALARFARRAFPEWGVSLEALIVAMVGLHEVAGPICFRRALVRAGEVTEGIRDAEGPLGGRGVVASGGG